MAAQRSRYSRDTAGPSPPSPPTSCKRRRLDVQDNLGEHVDAAELAKAKALLTKVMKEDPVQTRRLAYLVESGKVKSGKPQKATGDDAILPPCVNKYELLRSERVVEMLLFMDPDAGLVPMELELMRLEDQRRLLRFALALSKKGCALSSKRWGSAKQGAKDRYDSLGGNRLRGLTFVKKGDDRYVYYVVEYPAGAAYTLEKHPKKSSMFFRLCHVSGKTARLTPMLDNSWHIVDNDDDREAYLVSPKEVYVVPCKRVFEKAGIDPSTFLPVLLDDTRVGVSMTARSSSSSALALCDGEVEPQETSAKVKQPPRTPKAGGAPPARMNVKGPPGSGAVVKAAPPPPIKRR